MTRKFPPLTCPKCRRVAYVVCAIKHCSCWRKVPKGKKPLRWMKDGDRQKCGYCGFTAHVDYWFERELSLNPIPEAQR